MAEPVKYHGRSALTEAADRLELVVRGVRNRQLTEVGQAVPMQQPSSTLYVRSDEAIKGPIMSNPAQTWAEMSSGGTGAFAPRLDNMPKAQNRGWRHHMPWPVRWVMGWP